VGRLTLRIHDVGVILFRVLRQTYFALQAFQAQRAILRLVERVKKLERRRLATISAFIDRATRAPSGSPLSVITATVPPLVLCPPNSSRASATI
jgi:hypothetical protein